MFYVKKESYRFSMPKEYYAYLAFKDRLRELGVTFVEEGGHTEGTITVTARGSFEVDKNCDILGLIQNQE